MTACSYIHAHARTLIVLSVGKPGGHLRPVRVPLASVGAKPSCPSGRSGGGATWIQRLWQ